MNIKNIFYIIGTFISLITIGVVVVGANKINASESEMSNNLNDISSYSKIGFENKDVEQRYQSIINKSNELSYKLNTGKMNELLKDSFRLKKDVEALYAEYLLNQQNAASIALKNLNTEMKDNEFIKVENTDIYRNLVTEAKAKSSSANIDELKMIESDLKKGLELYKNEVEESKKADLINSLRSTLPEAQKLEDYLNTKTGNDAIKAKITDFKNKIDQFIVLENVKNNSFETLEKKSQDEILPILAVAKSDVEKIKVEEAAARQKLVDAEKENWKDKTPPQSPLGPEVPKQILVNLTTQRMYLYDKGEIIKHGPVTTGKEKYDTVTGTYSIYAKKQKEVLRSPFPDVQYEIPVDYWIPFYQGYGFHDASWRKEYGGQDYKTAGSHGCVNTPYDLVKFLYEWADIGTKVVIVP